MLLPTTGNVDGRTVSPCNATDQISFFNCRLWTECTVSDI